jgi:hypothetical protein
MQRTRTSNLAAIVAVVGGLLILLAWVTHFPW